MITKNTALALSSLNEKPTYMKHPLKISTKDHKLIFELYELYKSETRNVARLPLNDFRRPILKKKPAKTIALLRVTPLQSISLKNALMKIAAMW